MVLAQIVKRRQFEQGREQGREESREEDQREYTKQLEAWAKENDIPIENLPKLRKPKVQARLALAQIRKKRRRTSNDYDARRRGDRP